MTTQCVECDNAVNDQECMFNGDKEPVCVDCYDFDPMAEDYDYEESFDCNERLDT